MSSLASAAAERLAAAQVRRAPGKPTYGPGRLQRPVRYTSSPPIQLAGSD
ncbi:MAG: hypothetical protein RMI91_05840 [Gemmatales bacterium]|nr:hypothetical protein [Gemmatales bacterium]MDW7994157.1 hypothetical protein [Gemmatales bacterium]